MKQDPELLLRSDVSKDDDHLKVKWIESILQKYAVSTVLDYGTRRQYAKLKYRGLATQLRPFLEDRSQPDNVRIEIVAIAAACNEQALQDILVAIALDNDESIKLREEAADALANIGDSSTKAQLKQLALLPILDSKTRKLKEYALRCVWPDQITTAELLNSIDLHYKQDHEYSPSNSQERDLWDIGGYLPSLLEQHSEKFDLVTCLRWVQRQPKSHVLPFAYQDMIDIIMVSAWEQIEQEQVADAFANVVLSRIYLYDSIISGRKIQESDFYTIVSQRDRQRRSILRLMVLRISEWNYNLDRLIYAATPFIATQDVSWFIQEFSVSNSPMVRANWAQILQILLIRGLNIEQVAYLYNTCQTYTELNQALCYPFDAVSLESEIAKIQRQRRADCERHRAERAAWYVDKPFIEPSPVSRICQYLTECEAGKYESWWRISYWMMIQPDGTRDPHHVENTNIENLPVWLELTDEQRERVVQKAKDYILNFVPDETEWLKEGKYAKNYVYYSIVAGYRALHLLLAKERLFMSSLSVVIWQRWATTVLYYSWSSYRHSTADQSDLKIHQELLCYAYQHASERVVASLLLIIELDNEYGVESLLKWTEVLWNSHLAEALVGKLKEERLKPLAMYELLVHTLKHNEAQAKQYAESLVNQSLQSNDGTFPELSVLAARALLNGLKDAGWDAVWPSFQAYPKFGEQVFSWILHDYDHYPHQRSYIQEKLTESQLVDFYILLCQQFPPDEDWRWGGQITQREEFARFRDTTLYVLEQRDPKLALEALQELDSKLPHNESVRWQLANVQDRLQRDTWQPPLPGQIIELVRERKMRQMQVLQINTGGGPYIAGDVYTEGGDFIGRDKKYEMD